MGLKADELFLKAPGLCRVRVEKGGGLRPIEYLRFYTVAGREEFVGGFSPSTGAKEGLGLPGHQRV